MSMMKGNNSCSCMLQAKNGIIYRSNPFFKENRSWNYWAIIDLGEAGRIPIHLVIYIHVPPLMNAIKSHCNTEITQQDNSICATAHSLPVPLSSKPIHAAWGDNHKAHHDSILFEY